MDTIIGYLISFSGVFFLGMFMDIMPFYDVPSIGIVFGGVIAAALITFNFKTVMRTPAVVKNAFTGSKTDPLALINKLVEFAEIARRDGILALENVTGSIEDLIQMLKAGIGDPDALTKGMAVALITTFYGSMLSCNITPLTDKLANKHGEEMMMKNIILQGVMSIQSGDNPRIVEQKLMIYLPPKLRVTKDQGK